ncbi:hypothetical protein I7I51_08055 [Histoplasma capsulatum]|uniref:Uncharacterized protein n=1 Tax=Ajellomyces capsulatus TaxID=5037 RepID=A0A8A1M370_AJECA|nr:hypothetical protein I7I51_08055 [Histoplasma capsulatum]
MYPIVGLIQKIQDTSPHSGILLGYFRNAIIWSCVFLVFVTGIAGRTEQLENHVKASPTIRSASHAHRKLLNKRARYHVHVLPTILEEEEEHQLLEWKHIALLEGDIVSRPHSQILLRAKV